MRLGSVCRDIVDNHEKENALNIVTEERTYHIYAESPEDARYHISVYSISSNLWLLYEPCFTWCVESSTLWLPVEVHCVIFNYMFADFHFLNSLWPHPVVGSMCWVGSTPPAQSSSWRCNMNRPTQRTQWLVLFYLFAAWAPASTLGFIYNAAVWHWISWSEMLQFWVIQ